jgi:hypothetical protein
MIQAIFFVCYKSSAQTPQKTCHMSDCEFTGLLPALGVAWMTQKTQPHLVLRNLATDCLARICLHGNLFTNLLPSNGCTCNNMQLQNN